MNGKYNTKKSGRLTMLLSLATKQADGLESKSNLFHARQVIMIMAGKRTYTKISRYIIQGEKNENKKESPFMSFDNI